MENTLKASAESENAKTRFDKVKTKAAYFIARKKLIFASIKLGLIAALYFFKPLILFGIKKLIKYFFEKMDKSNVTEAITKATATVNECHITHLLLNSKIYFGHKTL